MFRATMEVSAPLTRVCVCVCVSDGNLDDLGHFLVEHWLISMLLPGIISVTMSPMSLSHSFSLSLLTFLFAPLSLPFHLLYLLYVIVFVRMVVYCKNRSSNF